MAEKTKSSATSGAAGADRRSPAFYVAIAVMELAVVGAAIYLHHGVATRFEESVAQNEAWADRVVRYARLSEFGNGILSSTRGELRRSLEQIDAGRLQASLGSFGDQLIEARQDLVDRDVPFVGDSLGQDLDAASKAMQEFSAQTWVVISYREKGMKSEAIEAMRKLNASAATVKGSLQHLLELTRKGQKSAFDGHRAAAEASESTGLVLLAIAIILLAASVFHIVRLFRDFKDAGEAADSAARSKDVFLANMSYAIRTPMNGIIGMTDLVLDTALTRDQRAELEEVRASAETLLGTLNNILDYSKIQAHKLELEEAEFDIRSTIYNAVRTMAPRAYRKGLELVWQVAPEVPETVQGDASHLQQIFLNLLDNAITYTDQGEIVVRVRRDSASDDEAVLSFDVTDTGIGIPADKREGLFEAFRSDREIGERVQEGVGLGLAICAELVQLMGGQIAVESDAGSGSTFRFTARFGLDADSARRIEAPVSSELRDHRVLIVDDNATHRRVVTGMLRSFRAIPTPVGSGDEAISALQNAGEDGRPFHAALIDLDMPGMDGIELAKKIGADSGMRDTALVAVSATGNRDEQEQASEAGIEGFLVKPVRQRDLFDVVTHSIERHVENKKSEEAGKAPVSGEAKSGPAGTRELQVLLADDNRVDRTLGIRLLEKRGHKVTAVESGEQAVAAFDSGKFDVILMDVQMPGMDGLEATAAIRAREKEAGGHVPIVALTAHDMKGRCLEVGMDAYVTKPVDPHEVAEVMARLVPVSGGEAAEPDAEESTHRPLDEEAALERTGGDKALLVDLAEMCLADSPVALERIREGLDGNDPKAVERAAHKLKGSLLVLAADPASDAAYRLESFGAQGALDKAAAALAELERELERLKPCLTRITQAAASAD